MIPLKDAKKLQPMSVFLRCHSCYVWNLKTKAYVVFSCGHSYCRKCFYVNSKRCAADVYAFESMGWDDVAYENEA
jgi:late competence protein required for DNA uptake (superfamily II DNA/RNA helicase)